MPHRQRSSELSSIDRLSQILLVSFLFILVLEVLPKEIELNSFRAQKDFNDLMEVSGGLRSLSQRISFMALARLNVTNKKLIESLEGRIQKSLKEFDEKSVLLLEKVSTSEYFSEDSRKLLLQGSLPLGDTLDKFSASAKIVLQDFEDGFDDLDFLLLMASSTSDVYSGLGNFSQKLKREADNELSHFIFLQDLLIVITIISLIGVGIYVIHFLPARIRSEFQLRYESEQALKSQIDALEKFSAVVAHDLRGPLHNIHSAGALLSESLKDDKNEQDLELTGMIVRQSERLSSMIGQLLSLARSKSGRISKERIHLSELVERVENQLGVILKEQSVEISVLSDMKISVDAVLFEGVLQNLIENSMKHAQVDEVRITLQARSSEVSKGMVEIVYKDNGVGIDPKMRNSIFEPFRKGDTKDMNGVGLGLSFVKEVIQRHGGVIEALSDAGNPGAIFSIRIPR